MQNATNETQNNNGLDFFAYIEQWDEANKPPREWTLEDCKKRLKVNFDKSKRGIGFIDVTVRLHGVTLIKFPNGKSRITIDEGAFLPEEVLEQVQSNDAIVEEARQRMFETLDSAKQARINSHRKREANHCTKTADEIAFEKEARRSHKETWELIEEFESDQEQAQPLSV